MKEESWRELIILHSSEGLEADEALTASTKCRDKKYILNNLTQQQAYGGQKIWLFR